jgi:hypothetical protein
MVRQVRSQVQRKTAVFSPSNLAEAANETTDIVAAIKTAVVVTALSWKRLVNDRPPRPDGMQLPRPWLEHDPEKWKPVFGKDHAPAKC